jgi:hypothetical protein
MIAMMKQYVLEFGREAAIAAGLGLLAHVAMQTAVIR